MFVACTCEGPLQGPEGDLEYGHCCPLLDRRGPHLHDVHQRSGLEVSRVGMGGIPITQPGSIILFIIYYWYLKKPHIREYLGVEVKSKRLDE